MLKLNLVSAELKKQIKLQHVYKMLRRANYILIIITIFIAVVILTAKVILQNNFNKVTAETTLITKNSQSFDERARKINSRLFILDDIQNDFVPWSMFMEDIARDIPSGIKLTLFEIEKENSLVKFRGKAETRDILITLKESLEKKQYLNKINFPVSSLLEKENINFSLDINFYLNKIKADIIRP
jgi:hypothetical protein